MSFIEKSFKLERLFPLGITNPYNPSTENTHVEPCLVSVMGVPGSGKTYLAAELAKVTKGISIDIDDIRQFIFSSRTAVADIEVERSEMAQAYQYRERLIKVITQLQPKSLFLPNTGRSIFHREELRRIATELQLPLHQVVVITDKETVRERVLARRNVPSSSNILREEDLLSVIEQTIPYPKDAFYVSGEISVSHAVKQVIYHLLSHMDSAKKTSKALHLINSFKSW